jgi:hypothetical protein
MKGKDTRIYSELAHIFPSSSRRYGNLKRRVGEMSSKEGSFMEMRLIDQRGDVIGENFYWIPDENGNYSGLQKLDPAAIELTARMIENGKIQLKLKNDELSNPVAFFCRVALIDPQTGRRVLPVFYSDNYVSVVPGEEKEIIIESGSELKTNGLMIRISGWNVLQRDVPISQ